MITRSYISCGVRFVGLLSRPTSCAERCVPIEVGAGQETLQSGELATARRKSALPGAQGEVGKIATAFQRRRWYAPLIVVDQLRAREVPAGER